MSILVVLEVHHWLNHYVSSKEPTLAWSVSLLLATLYSIAVLTFFKKAPSSGKCNGCHGGSIRGNGCYMSCEDKFKKRRMKQTTLGLHWEEWQVTNEANKHTIECIPFKVF